MSYKKTKDSEGNVRNDQIKRKSDGAWIPFDSANTDYQLYLEWLKIDGHEPEAAD
tara:strand:- start:29 stop:193 length:165 start_codon:yes stop_codon:yes gene_type:complete